MSTEAENSGQAAARGCGEPYGPSGDPSPEQREAAYQEYAATLHSNHCVCVEALTARLAAVERERDVYRTALEKLATWQAWARSQDGGGDYIYGCHARCEALGALEEVNPDLDLRTLGYEPEEPTDGR